MEKMNPSLLSRLPVERVVARVGLISDTHMPQRCAAFPTSVFDVLRGVDLLLHAGDLGELWVLDRLSAIAPVVAVHGNDDTPDAIRELPYQQLLSIAGQRILLWHSHYPDPGEEQAHRGGSWQPKLDRLAERGQQVGAQIVVFGHAHIPMTCHHDGVWLVNPGALASGSLFTRQKCKTVALLLIRDDGTPSVAHVDLAAPDQPYVPDVDLQAGFEVAHDQFEGTIVEQALLEDVARASKQTYRDLEALKRAVLPLSHRCWAGEKQYITRAELLKAIERGTTISATDREKVVAILAGR
jgi:putative phosphoesterase